MSALRKARMNRPPTFSVSEYVDIDIDPEDLEAAGWVFVGKDSEKDVPRDTVLDTVHRWHDNNHEGPWRWCQDELCDTLRGRETHS